MRLVVFIGAAGHFIAAETVAGGILSLATEATIDCVHGCVPLLLRDGWKVMTRGIDTPEIGDALECCGAC